MESFWIVFGTSKDIFQIFWAQTSKQFLWKPFTRSNFKRLYKAYKGFYRITFSIEIFQKFHLKWNWIRTIWNHSGSFLELLKIFFSFFTPKLQKKFLWKSFTSPNFKRLYSAYKGSYRITFSIQIFQKFHLKWKWTRTIWNHSGLFLELLKTLLTFLRPNFNAIPLKTLYNVTL